MPSTVFVSCFLIVMFSKKKRDANPTVPFWCREVSTKGARPENLFFFFDYIFCFLLCLTQPMLKRNEAPLKR